jgi:hypothetical protein
MSPTFDELNQGLIAVGTGNRAIEDVSPKVLAHLEKLWGLIQRDSNGWSLTPEGSKLLRQLLERNSGGNSISN